MHLRNVRQETVQSKFRGYLTALRDVSDQIVLRFKKPTIKDCGPGSTVCIATDYGLDGPGSNPGGDEIFRPSTPALGAHPASMVTGYFSGVKCGRGLLLTTHPLLVPRS